MKLTTEDLAKFLGKSTEELLKLTKKEDGTDKSESELSKDLTALLNGKIAAVKTEAADLSLKNGLEKREKLLISKFGLEAGTKFDDAIAELESRFTDLKAAADGKTTAVDKELETKYKTAQTKIQEMERAFQAEKANATKLQFEFEQNKLTEKVVKSSLNYAIKNGLQLPADPEAAEKMVKALIKEELKGRTLKEENGKIHYLDADGNLAKDASYNVLEVVSDVSTHLPTYFPKSNSNAGGNVHPPAHPPAKGGSFTFGQDDLTPSGFMAKYNQLKSSGKKEEMEALAKQFNEANSKK